MASDVWVGIDISKAKVDVCVLDEERRGASEFARDAEGLAELVKLLRKRRPRLVLLEATGGYERSVLQALHAAALPEVLYLQRWSGGRPGSVQAVAPEGRRTCRLTEFRRRRLLPALGGARARMTNRRPPTQYSNRGPAR